MRTLCGRSCGGTAGSGTYPRPVPRIVWLLLPALAIGACTSADTETARADIGCAANDATRLDVNLNIRRSGNGEFDTRLDFGDGTTSVRDKGGVDASHTYREPGTYNITMKVTDKNGSATDTCTVTVPSAN